MVTVWWYCAVCAMTAKYTYRISGSMPAVPEPGDIEEAVNKCRQAHEHQIQIVTTQSQPNERDETKCL